MRKVIIVLLLLCSSCAFAVELPDAINDWLCVNEYVVPLIPDANHENLGRIVYRDYERETPKSSVNVILTEGKGTGSLYVPERVRDSKGLMPSEYGYKILEVSGRKSILEINSYLPLVLAVDAGDNIILTLESSSLTEAGLVGFAEEILSTWSSTK